MSGPRITNLSSFPRRALSAFDSLFVRMTCYVDKFIRAGIP